jgi:thiamine-monophosphate kinase
MTGGMKRRGEFERIADLFAPLSRTASGALGLTDDAAFLIPSPGHELVVTTDTLIAGVHFLPDDPPAHVAQKALRVNLSDLAAKGARPVGMLQALALSADLDEQYLEDYARGLGEDVAHFNIPLIGGDTTSTPKGPLVITITALGEVPVNNRQLRSGAQVGDLLCVSGTIGDGAFGLRILRDDFRTLPQEQRMELVARYRVPQPRLALGQALRGRATACMDISDGLCADVGHICAASGVAAEIEWRKIPMSAGVRRLAGVDRELRPLVLGGGDDYELAFTIPPSLEGELAAIAHNTATPVTVIGRIVARGDLNNVRVLDERGADIAVPTPGYVHR